MWVGRRLEDEGVDVSSKEGRADGSGGADGREAVSTSETNEGDGRGRHSSAARTSSSLGMGPNRWP